ncbi:PHP domain protein [Treponema primitia ZAS-2]|uniref:PHP domain protein n=1 Tax=Treponema primitia (strain ATCC BAA-887 / DSM 12427 / ZAS-2) TaxID=545694 RepID=F5YPM9_TREPZ|nr:PHP domain-containing protein [Treponema primitia]AEF85217.1 PHP domain protein [Treponema primitia ZAS-2]
MIDLHTHSRASDGSLTPSQLIQAAKERGISALALTDHDTVDGLEEARVEAVKAGIRFIPGIELEIRYENEAGASAVSGEFHLLGLGLREIGPGFRETLTDLGRRRENRNLQILDRMVEQGIQAEYSEVQALSGGGSVGRPHFADLLVKRGIVKNREQAFDRFLGKGRPLYIPKEGLEFTRALSLVRDAGGIPVLAHPMSLYIAWGRLPDFIADLAAQGLAGIEAWHPTTKVQACKRLEELGRSLGLYITAGSDFHGESRPDRKLGITAGGLKIDDFFLDSIPPLQNLPENAIIQE